MQNDSPSHDMLRKLPQWEREILESWEIFAICMSLLCQENCVRCCGSHPDCDAAVSKQTMTLNEIVLPVPQTLNNDKISVSRQSHDCKWFKCDVKIYVHAKINGSPNFRQIVIMNWFWRPRSNFVNNIETMMQVPQECDINIAVHVPFLICNLHQKRSFMATLRSRSRSRPARAWVPDLLHYWFDTPPKLDAHFCEKHINLNLI